ncbi:type II toxin-antitoxin system prevent-host-death family antitoxin [Streptomyces cahuitamycinicus]|nr:type II toxin-antitoxin system prevent-host-death family antitoxin [Streptomyces cahuitamycinicus]
MVLHLSQVESGDAQATVSFDHAEIVTMRELNQNLSQVIARVNETLRPALVTRHGVFQAAILPLAGATLQNLVLAHDNPDLVQALSDAQKATQGSDAISSDGLAAELGLDVSKRD